MPTTSYTRLEITRLLEVDESFIVALEEEQIVVAQPSDEGPRYSQQAFERIRLADTLMHELEVNLPGTAIIVRMREQLTQMQQEVFKALQFLRMMTERSRESQE